MKVLLYDFRWRDEGTIEFQASSGDKFGRKTLQIGDDISIAVQSNVKCGGSRIDDVWTPCPQHATGKAKCDICKARERNFVFTAFDGFDRSNVTEADLSQISGPHVVYLAMFDRGLVKIGVSGLSRKVLRQIEQGSHFTLYIAQTPDGIAARQIETLMRKDGIADKIKPSQKKDFLCPEISETEGEKLLRDIFQTHVKALDDYDHLKSNFLETPEFVSWKDVYHLGEVEQSSKGFHTVELGKDESVSGKILASKGPFLVIETPEELVALCAKDLFGREIDFTPMSPGLNLNTAFQSALF